MTWPRLALILALVLACLPIRPAEAQDVTSYLLSRINELRAANGLNALSINPALTTAAQGHSQYLASNPYIHPHRENDGSLPQDRAARAGYSGRASENVVGGSGASVEWAFNWWMNSPVHYRNMLGTWQEIGIGFADGGGYGRWYTTMFGDPGRAAVFDPEGSTAQKGTVPPGGSVAVSRPRATARPLPTHTPTITLTPSITFTPRATFTPTYTATWYPASATPLVLEVTPQATFVAALFTPTPDQVVASPTETASPSPSPVPETPIAALPAPTTPPDSVAAADPGNNPLRGFIPLFLLLNGLIVGGLLVRAVWSGIRGTQSSPRQD